MGARLSGLGRAVKREQHRAPRESGLTPMPNGPTIDRMPAVAAIATPQTDAKLAARERRRGAKTKLAGKPVSACPWKGGMCAAWWMEGYDRPYSWEAKAL